MSEFEVKIYKITIEDHPGADLLELVIIGGYRSVVQKGVFKSGSLVAYIPCGSIVPEGIIETLGLTGRLAGAKRNRVKEIKLRGILSEGIIYPIEEKSPISMTKDILVVGEHQIEVMEGDEVSAFMNITKYIPPIPMNMGGEVYNAGEECTIKYDIENYKKFPHILQDGEDVVITEKIHGTNMQFGIMPEALENELHYRDKYIVASKGLGGQGLCFKHNDVNGNKNVYVRIMHQKELFKILQTDTPMWILGEVYGVQDLKYGCTGCEIGFRVFDICTGKRGDLRWYNDAELDNFCDVYELERVPVLYRGPFSESVMLQHCSGKETVSGTMSCIREGIVIRPTTERRDVEIGRVQLKYVSDQYLTRKHGSENS